MIETKKPIRRVTSEGGDGAKLSASSAVVTKRIVLLAPELFKAEGGIARISRLYLQSIAETSPKAKLSVIVLNDAVIPFSSLVRYGAYEAESVACDQSKLKCAQALWKATRFPGTHVVCTHIHLAPLLWAIRLLRPSMNYDIVVHGIEVWRPLSWSSRNCIAKARHILSVSDYTRSRVIDQTPNHADKVLVLPNALDPSFELRTNGDTTVPNTILTVSRLAPHDHEKGIDHLIEAMAQVVKRKPSAQLRIVGKGTDRARLERLANNSPARAHITFLGFLAESELKDEFQRCAIFALPSKKEGFGLVYLEAMAAGKPCIVAKAGGAPEVIDEHSGLLVPYADIDKLAEAMITALSRKWEPTAICHRAAKFSYSSFVAKWQTISSSKA